MQSRNEINKTFSISRPLLPSKESLLPYMRYIDDSRQYSNGGGLLKKLQQRLAQLFDIEDTQLAVLNNGTAALQALLKVQDMPEGAYCALPAWTFKATACSVIAAGFKPFFIDVDIGSWSLSPDTVAKVINVHPEIKAVVVVVPFGASIDIAAWQVFKERSNIPVIVDAASGFDYVVQSCLGKVFPTMISTHATKAFATGEGGIALSPYQDQINQIKELLNFGVINRGAAKLYGANMKMSEYAAAVGHAEMDSWQQKRDNWLRVMRWYQQYLDPEWYGHHLGEGYATSTCNVFLKQVNANQVIQYLKSEGIEAKKWWQDGCHYWYNQQNNLVFPNTKTLVNKVVGLPCSVDMFEEDIAYITSKLDSFIRGRVS